MTNRTTKTTLTYAGLSATERGETSAFDRPADRLLLTMRQRGLDYRCLNAPGQWRARCPLCSSDLLIVEQGAGGSVSMTCRGGCEPNALLSAVTGLLQVIE